LARQPFRSPSSPRPRGGAANVRPGTTRRREARSHHCLAVSPPNSRSVLLRPHSPSAAFQSPEHLRSGTGIPLPEAAEVPALASIVAHSVTSVESVTPRGFRRCTSRLPPGRSLRSSGRHSAARRTDFRGQEPEAPPYPSTATLFQFGSVSECTDRQALSGLSWLSFSPLGFPRRRG